MIIDLILGRINNAKTAKARELPDPYNPREFYDGIMDWYELIPETAGPIARAMDEGEEADVKKELCTYIDNHGYNPGIKKDINKLNWL